jgi:hypothetical protein
MFWGLTGRNSNQRGIYLQVLEVHGSMVSFYGPVEKGQASGGLA